jgi:hypothetical protein
MAEEITIKKDPRLGSDQDYAFLREAGRNYIEELGSKLWTDYNEHDPGITILEALCYAITELGYRTDFPMQDLLTGPDGKIASSQTLYTAKNILTQSPLTIDDYRKLLIDIVGVHNAWFFTDDFYVDGKITTPAGEIAIYADCKKDALTYNVTPHPVFLSGLFKVLLDLDNDLQFGDLNNGELQVLNPATTVGPHPFKAGDVSLTVIFPAWNETDKALFKSDPNSVAVTSVTITQEADEWKISANFGYTTSGNPLTASIDGRIIVDLEPSGYTIVMTDILDFFSDAFTGQVLNLYILKIQKAKNIVQTVIRELNENRNLCEDFVSADTVKDEEIAICCDIDVAPDADMEQVQADVFYAIEEYLNPSVRFYLLNELTDRGYTTDEIFEGPVLKHGFIDTAELEKTQLRKEIYTSDIINLLMDIKGVLSVANFRMTKYDINGNPFPGQTGLTWCMPVTQWHKPVFSETRSKIIFYKNQFPFLPSLAEVRDTLRWLRAVNARNKLTGHTDDLAIPEGKYSPLDSYTSVQYLFPQTYGIGKAGLPASAPDDRRAMAKQLKAYLMFYDQLLADFFSQLKNAKELFSTDTIVQTYFTQFLDGIADIDPVYKKNGASQDLLKLLFQAQDSTVVPPNDWQKLAETNETFLDRRTRFLDHLMARFAESFNEYVLLMYSLDYQAQQETQIKPAELIKDKIQFLKNYPKVSYQRARAFDYFPQKDDFTIDTTRLWETDNVSGLEKKLSLLTGIDNYFRRFLYCIGRATVVTTGGTPSKYQFIFKDLNGDTLTSAASYDTLDLLNAALPQFLTFVLTEENYTIQKKGGTFQAVVADNDGNVLAVSNNFPDKNEAGNAITRFILEFNTECDSTGLHLIEHILLRPRNNTFALAPVCLDSNCDFCGEEDPYSFRMSIVLPYWPAHFRSTAFRSYFEDMVRREAPAHTTVKVCWLNNELMYEFETAYKNWLTALANFEADASTINDLQAANDELLNLLFNLHSEYPGATLYDCAESKTNNPVLLGKTVLGSFKN